MNTATVVFERLTDRSVAWNVLVTTGDQGHVTIACTTEAGAHAVAGAINTYAAWVQ